MGDSIKKYYEMVEDGLIEDDIIKPNFKHSQNPIISEGHKKQAYQILVEYPEEAILEAARILKNGN